MTQKVKAIRTYFVIYVTREHHFKGGIEAKNRKELKQLISIAIDEGAQDIKIRERRRTA